MPNETLILATTALALIVILCVLVAVLGRKPFAWYRLWRKRRYERMAAMDDARQDFASACDEAGVSRFAAAMYLSVHELNDPVALKDRASKLRASVQPPVPGTNTITEGADFGKRNNIPYRPTGGPVAGGPVTREEVVEAVRCLELAGRARDDASGLYEPLDTMPVVGDVVRFVETGRQDRVTSVMCNGGAVGESGYVYFYDGFQSSTDRAGRTGGYNRVLKRRLDALEAQQGVWTACPTCQGKGWLAKPFDGAAMTEPCWACVGAGKVFRREVADALEAQQPEQRGDGGEGFRVWKPGESGTLRLWR